MEWEAFVPVADLFRKLHHYNTPFGHGWWVSIEFSVLNWFSVLFTLIWPGLHETRTVRWVKRVVLVLILLAQDLSLPKTDIISRPSQDVDVLAVLDFQISCFRSCFVSQKIAHQPRRPRTKTGASATTLGIGTRASKIQDGKDVEVLRSPDYQEVPMLVK